MEADRPTGDRGEDPVLRDPDAQPWGVLPSYLEFLHLRRGTVEVPARYRRLYEAFQRRGNRLDRGAGSNARTGGESERR